MPPNFDSNLLEPWLVSKLLERLGAVLHQLEDTKPNHLLAEVGLVTQDDLTEIWARNSAVSILVKRCVDEIVEERTRSQPGAMAVCAWDGQLTDDELEWLTARLATHLGRLLQGTLARDWHHEWLLLVLHSSKINVAILNANH